VNTFHPHPATAAPDQEPTATADSPDQPTPLEWSQVRVGNVSAYVLVRGNESAVVEVFRPNPRFTPDMATADESVAKRAGFEFETLGVGHGNPVLTAASDQVLELALTGRPSRTNNMPDPARRTARPGQSITQRLSLEPRARGGTPVEPKNRPSYREIIESDGGAISNTLALTANPPQSTDDIPFTHYISDDYFAREMDEMWPKVWQVACREEHVPVVGDYFVYDIGQYSIVITRTAEDELKGYYNSCLHRGTKLKPSGSAGWSPNIQCPFHGWTWNLTGELNEVPCSWEFKHLDYEASCLPEVQVDTWSGFVFINMDPGCGPLLDYLEVLPNHFAHWGFENWYVAVHTRKELNCNWKIAMEGFMEAYHTPVVHPEMCQVVGDWNMQHDIFGDHVSRDLCPLGVSSPSLDEPLSEQELLNRSRPGNPTTSSTADATLPEGDTARMIMAADTRKRFRDDYGIDLSTHTDAEVIDSLKYNVFPNLMFSGGAAIHNLSIFSPMGNDTGRCTIDRMIFLPVPKDGPRPTPAQVVTVPEHESWSQDTAIGEFSAKVLDQDTSIMRMQYEGMQASCKGAQTLSSYQESRVRWLHETLEKYVRP
jgi:phenylpropionate dioxygenase-like ring-hydroxylating dioxygenase large terminal subunit